MNSWTRLGLLVVLILSSRSTWGAKLPGALKPAEVENIVQKVGFGSASRLMRSAEAYPIWAGLKVGLELPITPAGGYILGLDGMHCPILFCGTS
ncbi:hypothetical protein EBT16_14475, partial [bacterium]|nr:hypothetical protein [bacterium]